jgi:cell division protein FtsZ
MGKTRKKKSKEMFEMILMEDESPAVELEYEDPGLVFDDARPPGANIKVIGVGGGGSNAVNRMISAQLQGVDFIAANTDSQALRKSRAPLKLQLGHKITKGLGAGANPEVGRQAALEDSEKIIAALDGADMVFITTGLGGGTGTGATPVIASLASELGALVVAVVTKPFTFEGRRRREQAEKGLTELRQCVDTVITIPNEKLLHTVERNTTLSEAFLSADDILLQAVQGISDLITVPGEINLDFADVKTIMSGRGMALMGTGISDGEHRAVEAAQKAISSPLLEDCSIDGAEGVLINITGGRDMTLYEVSEAATIIQQAASENAEIIFGTVIDDHMDSTVKITVIATGFDHDADIPEVDDPFIRADNVLPRTDLEQPAYTRVGKQFDLSAFDEKNPGGNSGYSENAGVMHTNQDLDIPTFLRRQMD